MTPPRHEDGGTCEHQPGYGRLSRLGGFEGSLGAFETPSRSVQ